MVAAGAPSIAGMIPTRQPPRALVARHVSPSRAGAIELISRRFAASAEKNLTGNNVTRTYHGSTLSIPSNGCTPLCVRALGIAQAGHGEVGSGPTLTRWAALQRWVRSGPMRNRAESRNPRLTIEIRGAPINPYPPGPATVTSPVSPCISTS